MKKCPTCDRTFEDSMKFCQVDGTPLVEDEPAFDPYATMVGKPAPPVEEAAPSFEPQPEEVAPIAEPENVLEMPEADPLKTMYVSEAEMKEAFGQSSEEPVIEIPPAPEPPSFSSPEPSPPSFGDIGSPPPSPFSAPEPNAEGLPSAAPFDESPTVMAPPPFEQSPPAPVAEWTPPPAPDAAWQNQQVGSNTPFQPPATGSVNQTIPIISLILGIVSICCYISPLTGLIAVILGFMGMKNANNDPQHYGGKGLAIAGMITGGLFFLIGTAYYVVIILMYAGIIAGSMLQGF
jgi:hypothetical protein